MAIWLATNGHERGFEAFDIGSQKSTKYNASRTNEVDGDDASELRFSFAMP
jgi:hypothetical protein